MIYADYDYYRNDYLGNDIAEEDFLRLSAKASRYIDYITKGRAKEQADSMAVQDCCCALADQYHTLDMAEEMAKKSLIAGIESTSGKTVKSETVGSWSQTYQSGSEGVKTAMDIKTDGESSLYAIAIQYLSITGLLYRGRRCPQ